MNRFKITLAAALASVLVLAAGCSQDQPSAAEPTGPPSVPATASADPTSTPDGAPTESALPNDLAVSPLKRTFQSAGLVVTVQYSAVPAVDSWTPNGAKSVRLFMTVVNKSSPGRKVYLTRAGVRFGLQDVRGDILGPDPVVDTSGLDPGYLVTSPYSYNQSFAVPPLDDSAVALTLDFKFETVTLVDPKAKDYTKQSSTNTVRVALKF